MELQDIVNIVGNGFFPIIACAIMFYQNGKLQATLQHVSETLVAMSERIGKIEDTLDEK